jgi:hypothetical protein
MMQAIPARPNQYAHRLHSSSTVSTPMRWLTRIFGCWHRQMNRPFTLNNETYRTCMRCGVRRHLNPGRSKMTGAYYYALPSAIYSSTSPKQVFSMTNGEQTGAPHQKRRSTLIAATD